VVCLPVRCGSFEPSDFFVRFSLWCLREDSGMEGLWLGPSPRSGKEEKVGGMEERGGVDINEFDQVEDS
jgi:hypothetical protein